ncbi:hypothetical protein O0L34_g12229 [Tuta absoluta]|nr:hypothetical protein O0L34_g12229 [Tuta absoluta]
MDPGLALEVAALSRIRDMEVLEAKGESDVQKVYRGGTAFVTGASGFLGKHYVEKLLRSTDIKKVYILVRPKKGKTAKQRSEEILANPLFDRLRKSKPGFSEKVHIVEGDITALDLGLSQQDRDTLSKEVSFIVHMAATVRFDEALSQATLTNVRGTREVLALAKTCPNLRAFIHVSTAYSNATRSKIKKDVFEQFYDVPISHQQLIETVENKDEKALAKINEILLQEWPNTYTFTKAVAEELLKSQSHGLPVCIVRPTIIINAYREPAPGWVDVTASYGPAGVMLGIGLGVVHCMLADKNSVVDLIPADLVNNAVMAAGWATASAKTRPDEPTIYCTGTSTRNPATWESCGRVHRTESRKIATPKAVWYCYSYDIKNPILFYLAFWFLHWIPAYLVDGVCFLTGKPRQFVKLYTKAYKLFNVFSFFTTNEWKFSDKNLWTLRESMSPADKQIYNFDVKQINWKEFMLVWAIGLRKYILKDGLKDTDYAIKKQNWFFVANIVFMAVYGYVILKVCTVLFTGLFSVIQYIY